MPVRISADSLLGRLLLARVAVPEMVIDCFVIAVSFVADGIGQSGYSNKSKM